MKFTAFFVLVGVLCLYKPASAQQSSELGPGYYVVVAAFSPDREDLAIRYTSSLKKRGLKASYGFNSGRGYYYVYLHYDDKLEAALAEMESTREMGDVPFNKAWVRIVTESATPSEATSGPHRPEPPPASTTPQEAEPQAVPPVPLATPVETITPEPEIEITFNEEIVQYEKITLSNTEVFLSLFNATNNRVVEGTVTVMDPERSRTIQEVAGNTYLTLPDPKNKSGKITLVCDAFGYRKITQELDHRNPLGDTVESHVELMGTTLMVYFDLIRYHRGDIGVMYNVYFYNDAALMRPESRPELEKLLRMMEENPAYRIRLHGHTNGNYHGRILTRSAGQGLFSLDGAKSSIGTAKQLSFARAEVVKEFLVENGIDPERVELKAWAGRRPLYDKHSVNAKRNVRVEVEIINE